MKMNTVDCFNSSLRHIYILYGILACQILLGGCSILHLRQENNVIYNSTILVGTVRHDGSQKNTGPIVVAAYSDSNEILEFGHYTRIHEPGPYELMVPMGDWRIIAFEDANNDLTYQQGEAIGQYSGEALPVSRKGGVKLDLNILLQDGGGGDLKFPVGTMLPSRRGEPPPFTSPGVIRVLEDPLFREQNGVDGFWRPMGFFKEFGGNISFIEPYDPNKIPILFVHGATGTPAGWRFLVDHIDRTRFQPWFYYYPSGASIKTMADLMFWKMLNLQSKYQFKDMYVIAHSMGGLVVRSMLVDYGQLVPAVKKFISISTPWNGDDLAENGVNYSPGVIPVWRDMLPQGEFARSIYRKKLPQAIDFYLFFGHRGNRNPLRPNNDSVITLATQLAPQVQEEAKMVFGFDEDHNSILTSEEVATLLADVLHSGAESVELAVGTLSGKLKIHFTPEDMPATEEKSWMQIQLIGAGKETSNGIYLTTSSLEKNTVFGPFRSGKYTFRLFKDGYRTDPIEQEITISPGIVAEVGLQLVPYGSVWGIIKHRFYREGDPAGVYTAIGRDTSIRSINLSGNGVYRVLKPVEVDEFNAWEYYSDGRDWAYKNNFAFYNIPQGTYLLTIAADGYAPYSEQRTVCPGQPLPSSEMEIQLTKLQPPPPE
jgi:pimeloyl-ACP methyl ester carboxylesterase